MNIDIDGGTKRYKTDLSQFDRRQFRQLDVVAAFGS